MMKKMTLKGLGLLLIFAAIQACSSDSDGSTVGDADLSASIENAETVSNGFVPGSLAVEGLFNTGKVRFQSTTEYCSQAEDDLIECQPVLLRRYHADAAEILERAIAAAKKIGLGLGGLSKTEEAKEVTLNDVEGYDSVTYKKTDNSLKLVALTGSEVTFYLSAQGENANEIEMKLLEENGQISQVTINFTSDTSWNASVFKVNGPCVDSDVRQPETMKILVDKEDDLWTGKAMAYLPRWNFGTSSPATCASDDPGNLSLTFYFDFVGNQQATKGKVFIFEYQQPALFQEASYEDAHGIPQVCETGHVSCTTTDPQNPFCNKSDTPVASFEGDDCSSVSQAVADAPFGPFADWDDPSTFYVREIEIPAPSEI